MLDSLLIFFTGISSVLLENRLYLGLILLGAFVLLMGVQVSIYSGNFFDQSTGTKGIYRIKLVKCIEIVTNRFPFSILSNKLRAALNYFMLNEQVEKSIITILTLIIPILGLMLYSLLYVFLKFWYIKAITLILCFMLPYYIFTLAVDYFKYSLRLKIPVFIDSFRSSFITHNRIKPALRECSKNADRHLGSIMLRVSDSADLNSSLMAVSSRIDDTWFNIFVVLLVNYRENGGELVNQLYKLNKTITRNNNIEKKKNKRLIWYELFTLAASIFSVPVILLVNRIILGTDVGLNFDATASLSKIVIYSLAALLIVRILRRL